VNGRDLLILAFEFLANTPQDYIEFGDKPTLLTKKPVWRARTMCSTLITKLESYFGRAPVDRVELYGKSMPRAEDYHRAILASSGFLKVQDIRDIRPGDLIAIRFRTRVRGFSGHCALVAGPPEQWTPGRWWVSVIDSTDAPHGVSDPREIGNYRGLGKAGMMLLCDENFTVSGYQWSPGAEPRLIADQERMIAIGRFV
jgi:hypothetical protein